MPAILDRNPSAKIIVLVRNPLEMVVSYHSQKVYSFNENEMDFETAWRMSELRANGRMVSADCNSPRYLNYKAIGRLGDQLSRVKATVPEGQLQVIVIDDLCSDSAAVYQSTLRFLDVPLIDLAEFSVVNARREHVWPSLAQFLMHPPSLLSRAERTVKRSFPGLSKATGRAVYGFGQRPKPKGVMCDRLRDEVVEEFRDYIDLLGRLLKRDLGDWYRDNPSVIRGAA
ncbi:MAG: sulfotransferase domain-containing protein [Pseudomonadota bacterium]